MQKLELTLPNAAENLALDEALLDGCAAGEIACGVFRLWEPDHYFVVLGRSSRPELEVNLDACRQQSIPVLRRTSGGGTILAGPGCLMYAVVLGFHKYPELRAIDRAHQFVRQRLAESLAPLVPGIHTVGTSDLAIDTGDQSLQKISGNSLRAKRTHLVYHGTLLYDFDLARITQFLATPTREPTYRDGRSHREFVANLPVSREQVVTALLTGWQVRGSLAAWPEERTKEIVRKKYIDDPKWIIHS